jgi:PelA/Pel-15E family pectate lyase
MLGLVIRKLNFKKNIQMINRIIICTLIIMISGNLSAGKTVFQEKEYKWSSSLLKMPGEWYSTTDAINIANSVIQYQSLQGGWPKSTDLAKAPKNPDDIPKAGDGRANSLDNDATTVPMEFLALVINATGEEKYKDSFYKGLDYLFNAQYPNGGWPQFWPLRGDRYYSRITYNDGAMIRVMNLLQNVAKGEEQYGFIDKELRLKAKEAVEKGIECILKTQVKQNGKLTVWCAQHDEKTLKPAWARAYEPPSLSGSESVGIVRFLMSLENPSPEIISAINGAVEWFKQVQIDGYNCIRGVNKDGQKDSWLESDENAKPLWARFYELETNKPLFLGRDSKFRYALKEIEVERRGGYRYYGNWANELLYNEYPKWLETIK